MNRKVVGFACAIVMTMVPASRMGAKDKVPISMGEYEIVVGGKRIGQEQFRIFKDKTFWVETTTTLYWPEPTIYEYSYELLGSSRIKELEMAVTRAGVVTELELKPRKKDWRCGIDGRGRKKVKQELGPQASTEIDFGSLLFNSFIVRRMGLQSGDKRTVDVIVLGLPEVNGKRVKHTYRRLEDEEIETKLDDEKTRASAYELTAPEGTHRIWFDSSGFALRGEFEHPAGTFEYDLVRLTSKPQGW